MMQDVLLGAIVTGVVGILGSVALERYREARREGQENRRYQYRFFKIKDALPASVVLYKQGKFLKGLELGKRDADKELQVLFRRGIGLDRIRTINDYVFRSYRDIWQAQEIWFQQHGRYFQGKMTMPAVPDYRENRRVELGFGLTDQIDDWRSVGYVDDYAPIQMLCDVYEGPQGHGFVVTAKVKIKGNVWKNQFHNGSEQRGIVSYKWVREDDLARGTTGIQAIIVSALISGFAYVLFLGYRTDYLGHYLAGFGGTLLLLVVPLALWKRSLGWIAPALLILAIGIGVVAEATVFRIAIFDPVDFYNQSLGACIAGACLVGQRRSVRLVLTSLAAGVILIVLGFRFAFA